MKAHPEAFGLKLRGNETAAQVWAMVDRIFDEHEADNRRRLVFNSMPSPN